jgi:hypothetical protein
VVDKMHKAEKLVQKVHLAELPVVHREWWAKHVSYTEFRRQGMHFTNLTSTLVVSSLMG